MEVQETPNSQNTSLSTTFKQTLEIRYGPGISEKFRAYEKCKIKLTKEETHIHFLLQARDQGIIPDGFKVKSPIPGERAKKILLTASKALIRSQINYHRFKKVSLLEEILQRFEEIREQTLEEDHEPIFRKIDVTCDKVRRKQEKIHDKKLRKHQNQKKSTEASSNSRTIVNVSTKKLTTFEESLISKGLNFTVATRKVPILDIISAADSVTIEEPHLADEYRWKVKEVLQKSRPTKPNLSKEETIALANLRKDSSIKILPADKGNATVIMDTSTYDQKIEDVLRRGNYRSLAKDPTVTIEGRIYRTLKKHERYIPEKTRRILTPHHSKPPHLYGLPKIHKQDMPLRPITSSRNAPTYELARFLLPILKPLQGQTASFVKNAQHFVELISREEIQPEDQFVSFDVESLYTNVPVKEALEVIKNKLEEDDTLPDRTCLPKDAIMDLLECCLGNSYFQEKERFFIQEDGLPMGSSLSPIIANIYMEYFEDLALDNAKKKPKLWLRYVDDTFIIWNGNDEQLKEFLDHINNLRRSIKFTMEREENGHLPFLDVMVQREANRIFTSVYRKPTHTGQYLNYLSNHSQSTKHGIVRTLVDRALTICNSELTLQMEINNIKNDLQTNCYPRGLVERILEQRKNRTGNSDEEKERQPTLSIPYVKGLSEKIRRIGKRYSINTVFTSSNSLRSHLTKTKPTSQKDTKNCIYGIPCECGNSYIGETKRPLDVRVKEHRKNTIRGEVDKSGAADHAWTHGHKIIWSEAKIIHREQHWRKRKFKEAAIIQQTPGCFSKPSLDIKNVWKPLLTKCNLRS